MDRPITREERRDRERGEMAEKAREIFGGGSGDGSSASPFVPTLEPGAASLALLKKLQDANAIQAQREAAGALLTCFRSTFPFRTAEDSWRACAALIEPLVREAKFSPGNKPEPVFFVITGGRGAGKTVLSKAMSDLCGWRQWEPFAAWHPWEVVRAMEKRGLVIADNLSHKGARKLLRRLLKGHARQYAGTLLGTAVSIPESLPIELPVCEIRLRDRDRSEDPRDHGIDLDAGRTILQDAWQAWWDHTGYYRAPEFGLQPLTVECLGWMGQDPPEK